MTTKQTKKEPTKPIETWAQELNTPLWLFGAAKTKFDWATGKPMTEANYTKLIKETQGGAA